MDAQPVLTALAETGMFEAIAAPRVSGSQVTLLGRVPKDPLVQTRWGALMRNVLLGCRPQELVDFSRYYRLVAYMVQTQAGTRPEQKVIWNWRIVAVDQAFPVIIGECQKIIDARARREYTARSLAAAEAVVQADPTATTQFTMPAPGLPAGLRELVTPLTSGALRNRGGR